MVAHNSVAVAKDVCEMHECTNAGKGNHYVCTSDYGYHKSSDDRAKCNCGNADICECRMNYGECNCQNANTCIATWSKGNVDGMCAKNVTCDHIDADFSWLVYDIVTETEICYIHN
jgi:hypothetical protein